METCIGEQFRILENKIDMERRKGETLAYNILVHGFFGGKKQIAGTLETKQ
jgi:hypothetical protein